VAGVAELAGQRSAQVQSITRSVVTAVQALWRDVTPDRILSAMQGETGRQILGAVTAGQMSAAAGAQAFVTASMLDQGAAAAPAGPLDPAGFAGLASDTRSLATLLYLPGIRTAQALAAGQSAEAASLAGLNQMALLVGTQITDTARGATSVTVLPEERTSATASRLNSSGYRLLRLLLLPTWHYFLWNSRPSLQVSDIKGKLHPAHLRRRRQLRQPAAGRPSRSGRARGRAVQQAGRRLPAARSVGGHGGPGRG
jgi:hypothetical protein